MASLTVSWNMYIFMYVFHQFGYGIYSYMIFFTTDISKSHARRTSVWEMLFFHVCDDVIVLQAKYRWTILLEDPRADTT